MRIIRQGIESFNRHGLHNVSVKRIAAELNISPGNLTYHFRRKRDLVLATLGVLQDDLREALVRPTDVVSAQAGSEYMIRLFRTLWEFRFFLTALTHLLTEDRELLSEYKQFRVWLLSTLETDLRYLAEQGLLLKPNPPNSFHLLAENLWEQWLSWLRNSQILQPAARSLSNRQLYDIALHHWSLCEPWMKPSFARQFLSWFRRILLVEHDSRSS